MRPVQCRNQFANQVAAGLEAALGGAIRIHRFDEYAHPFAGGGQGIAVGGTRLLGPDKQTAKKEKNQHTVAHRSGD